MASKEERFSRTTGMLIYVIIHNHSSCRTDNVIFRNKHCVTCVFFINDFFLKGILDPILLTAKDDWSDFYMYFSYSRKWCLDFLFCFKSCVYHLKQSLHKSMDNLLVDSFFFFKSLTVWYFIYFAHKTFQLFLLFSKSYVFMVIHWSVFLDVFYLCKYDV